MGEIKLTLNNKKNKNEGKAKARDAEQRKKKADESLEDAWVRILERDHSKAKLAKLLEVKEAMEAGEIGREPENKRQFSAAEAERLWRVLEDRKKAGRIASLVENTPDNYYLVDSYEKLDALRYELIEWDGLVGVDCETFGDHPDAPFDPWDGQMAGFSLTVGDAHYYVPLNHEETTELSESDVFDALKTPLESAKVVMHNASFDGKWFKVAYDVNLIDNLYADTQLMAWAADERISHKLKDLSEKWLGLTESWTYDKLFSKLHRFNEVPLDAALVYAAGDTEKTIKLYNFIVNGFNKTEDGQRLLEWVMDVEMPVLKEFIYADLRGIGFNVPKALKLDEEYEKEETRIAEEIYGHFGEEINLNSSQQLSAKLFDELDLPDLDDGSTASKVLEKITSKHPVVELVLEYRQVNQLRKAFTKTLPSRVKPDGLIHQSHNTWGAVTTRFTCKNPSIGAYVGNGVMRTR